MGHGGARTVGLAMVAATTAGPACSGDGGTDGETGDPGPVHVCEKWGRAIPGARWTYENHYDPADPSLVVVTKYFDADFDPATGKFHLPWETRSTTSAGTTVVTGTTQYRCDDDGMWIEGTPDRHGVTTYTDGTTSEDHSVDTYTEPQLLLPSTFGTDAEWTSKGHWERTSTQYGPSSGTVNLTCVPHGVEDVVVPAGTFEAELVECIEQGSSAGVPTWYAADVGMVAFAATQKLVSFDP